MSIFASNRLLTVCSYSRFGGPHNPGFIPMTALCNTIERDLREALGEKELPPKMEAEDGYLF